MSSDSVPLITFAPITDIHHRWVALLIDIAEPNAGVDNDALLKRLFGELGLLEALGGLPCVMPLALTTGLSDEVAETLPAEQITFIVPLTDCLDPGRHEAIAALQQRGFRVMARGRPAAGQSLPAGIVSYAIDCATTPDAAVLACVEKLAGPHLALTVDTPELFSYCDAAGFAWIAGNSALTPPQEKSAANHPGRTVMLKLLAQIAGDADAPEIEKTLKQDPQLSYQLLKLVNSVAFSLPTPIANFTQAISLLGRRQLQRWLQLLLYARPSSDKHAANPLMPRAALRAGAMEMIAKTTGANRDVQDQAFMVGMFSLLEPLFGRPVGDIIAPLNLPEPVSDALIKRGGPLGSWLTVLEAVRGGPTEELRAALAAASITTTMWLQIQASSAHWAVQISREA